METEERAQLIQSANQLHSLRQGVVVVALVLLIVSFMHPNIGLTYLRSAAWFTAAIISLVHGSKLKALGQSPNYLGAVIYFLVSLLPLLPLLQRQMR